MTADIAGTRNHLVRRQAPGKAAKRVGVIGGMGPEATVEFMRRLLRATDAKDDIDHIPLIVDNNARIPSRIRFILGASDENPAPVLAAMTRRLCGAGAELLVMPCNTAHVFAEAVEAAADAPFINAVDLAAADAVRHGSPVGIVGSPILKVTGLYDKALQRLGAGALYPSRQEDLFTAIQRLKAAGPDAESRAIVARAARDLQAQGARAILVACTEFSLIAEEARIPGIDAVVDTLDLLVAETHRRAFA